MELNRNEVHIYRFNFPDHAGSVSSLTELLSPDELSKANRFKFPGDKQNYIICRGQLRKVLSEFTEESPEKIQFEYSDKGKPFLKNGGIFFNLSHSGERCIIAVSHIPETGVDIEKIREVEDLMNISKRYFSETEFEYLMQLPENIQTKEFFRIWTLKEAFIKAIGEGLSYPLKNFSVLSDLNGLPELNFTNNKDAGKEWELIHPKSYDGYYISLAVRSYNSKIIYK